MIRAVAIFVVLALVSAVAGADDDASARAFEIRHRSVTDAADLAGALLSEEGSITIKPRLRSLVVRDRPAILDQVADLLEAFDVPPRRVEVTLSLFRGRRPTPAEGRPAGGPGPGFSEEVRGVMETLGDFTVWTSYQPLGTQVVTGREGAALVAEITDQFGIALEIGAVNDTVVSFDRLTLRETVREEGRPDRVEDRYAAAMTVDAGKLTLVVAAKKPDSPQALFLALQAEPR